MKITYDKYLYYGKSMEYYINTDGTVPKSFSELLKELYSEVSMKDFLINSSPVLTLIPKGGINNES